mmetsp:Transcript_23649/g.34718  ORF Transcript_23649/g.34718 Transcript_23649/m.34718 type:complete len:288 (-) Transcript_23649:11-874(-)
MFLFGLGCRSCILVVSFPRRTACPWGLGPRKSPHSIAHERLSIWCVSSPYSRVEGLIIVGAIRANLTGDFLLPTRPRTPLRSRVCLELFAESHLGGPKIFFLAPLSLCTILFFFLTLLRRVLLLLALSGVCRRGRLVVRKVLNIVVQLSCRGRLILFGIVSSKKGIGVLVRNPHPINLSQFLRLGSSAHTPRAATLATEQRKLLRCDRSLVPTCPPRTATLVALGIEQVPLLRCEHGIVPSCSPRTAMLVVLGVGQVHTSPYLLRHGGGCVVCCPPRAATLVALGTE